MCKPGKHTYILCINQQHVHAVHYCFIQLVYLVKLYIKHGLMDDVVEMFGLSYVSSCSHIPSVIMSDAS